MSDLQAGLRSAFEEHGYDVADVSENRSRVRVTVRDEGAEADALRTVVRETVGEEHVFGLNVTSESLEGSDAMGTVVSFQHRP